MHADRAGNLGSRIRDRPLGGLRVRPESLGGIAEFSQHEADRGEADERDSVAREIFKILGQTTAAIEPSQSPLNDPTFGKHLEPWCLIGPLDDLDHEVGKDFRHRALKVRPLVAAIGEKPTQEREQAEQRGENQHTAIAVLNVRRMNDGMEQETYRIDQDMPLLALDLLARIVAMRIDAGPPFSALFTLWLSITQAVGLGSRPIFSRHFTYST